MKSICLKASTIAWLIFVMPVLGLLPLLLLTEIISPYGDAGRYAVALLRDLRGLVLPDPAPEASHVKFFELAPESAWWVIVVAVFFVSALALYYWWRAHARRAA